jgi:hypothetical protein|tara:strand:- start:46 stop:546 length:501 start_codon:yes stop_codon:yes gene_type:complete
MKEPFHMRSTIELRQFKLTNQEEVVTEVLDFGDEDTDHAIVVRNTMKLVNVENMHSGMRYYAFRPYMLYQGDGSHVQIINPGHVVSECSPSKLLVEQYQKAIEERIKDEDGLASLDETRKAMTDYHSKMSELMKDRLTGEELAVAAEYDSDAGANVIRFKPPGTMH